MNSASVPLAQPLCLLPGMISLEGGSFPPDMTQGPGGAGCGPIASPLRLLSLILTRLAPHPLPRDPSTAHRPPLLSSHLKVIFGKRKSKPAGLWAQSLLPHPTLPMRQVQAFLVRTAPRPATSCASGVPSLPEPPPTATTSHAWGTSHLPRLFDLSATHGIYS